MAEYHQYRDAITKSINLVEQNKSEALKLLDEAIAEAIREQQISRICTLCHHAAILSRDNLSLAQRYYEQSLTSNPENARALYGLATTALDQEKFEIARQYAARCHKALQQSEEGVLKEGYLKLIAKHWPDNVEPSQR
jgi:hypothetical protein